ncbi:MAG: MBL fold metallo-hydrolase [Armatimonadota bacterium]
MSALIETEVRPNVVVWTLGGEVMQTAYGTNCSAIIGGDGVILVDPLIAPAHARLVEQAVRSRTTAPVRFVVLTHHHTDHALGSSWFARQGVAVIAHRACAERMAAEHPGLIASRRAQPELRELFADAEPTRPSVTFDEGLTLHVDGLEVEVWHPGWAHTPGDAFLYVPAERVAICGDLLFNGYHYNYEDASASGVRKGLEALRALDAEVFVPGHGPVSGPEALDRQAEYHDAVEAIVRGADTSEQDNAVADAIRAGFPDHRLGIILPTAVRLFRESGARVDSG